MNEVCEMTFGTALGGMRTIRVPGPRAGIDVSHVETAASRFMVANPFNEKVGTRTGFQRAELVRTIRTPLLATE